MEDIYGKSFAKQFQNDQVFLRGRTYVQFSNLVHPIVNHISPPRAKLI